MKVHFNIVTYLLQPPGRCHYYQFRIGGNTVYNTNQYQIRTHNMKVVITQIMQIHYTHKIEIFDCYCIIIEVNLIIIKNGCRELR